MEANGATIEGKFFLFEFALLIFYFLLSYVCFLLASVVSPISCVRFFCSFFVLLSSSSSQPLPTPYSAHKHTQLEIPLPLLPNQFHRPTVYRTTTTMTPPHTCSHTHPHHRRHRQTTLRHVTAHRTISRWRAFLYSTHTAIPPLHSSDHSFPHRLSRPPAA